MEPKSSSAQTPRVEGNEAKLPVELLNLSPEEVAARASQTTQVLHEILERDHPVRAFREWGINE